MLEAHSRETVEMHLNLVPLGTYQVTAQCLLGLSSLSLLTTSEPQFYPLQNGDK